MNPHYLQRADARLMTQGGQPTRQWNTESPWATQEENTGPVPDWLRPQAPPMMGGGWNQSYQQPYQPFGYQQYGNQQYSNQGNGIKTFLHSKTIWAGIVTATASVFSYFQASEAIQAHPQATSAFGAGIGVLMVLLRLLTNGPVAPPQVTIKRSDPGGWPK